MPVRFRNTNPLDLSSRSRLTVQWGCQCQQIEGRRSRPDGHARRHRYGFRQGDCAQSHCAYLFANRRTNRMKVLVHDGFGIWLAARRLNQGKFHWPGIRHGSEMELDTEQLQALVLGLPWQRAVDAAC
ncbi:IS66 family insertion sequence element accessory protein TnpB [Pseudomonas helvetica]|uniref:IS66 family insertion sequence element accessory protein TnpB n=1 Tax=Pseudomonas helvetica TaxID=3136738 RepID=UPI00326738DF